MNPCVDLPSCLLSAFEFLHIPWPGEGPFAVDKPGHHVVFVSRVRALISCPHSSAVVGCQGVKVTPKPGSHWGSAALKTETSCVAMVELLSLLLTYNWASAYLGVSVSP